MSTGKGVRTRRGPQPLITPEANRESVMRVRKASSEEFKVKFGSVPGEINAKTFLSSLASLTEALDEINAQVGKGQRIEVNIKALKKGSFLVHISLNPVELGTLISSIDWDVVYKCVGTLVGIFTLRKLLKGEKPKSVEAKGDKVAVTTKTGNVVIVDAPTFNIYNTNVRVDEAIGRAFESLEADRSIDSLEITDKRDKTLIGVQRDDFEAMAVHGRVETPRDDEKVINTLATLHIFKLVWNKSRKWEFYYRGQKISAIIADESFFKRVDNGERFAKGDSLEVELQINQKFDETVNTFTNRDYIITNVIRHIPRLEEGNLDLV